MGRKFCCMDTSPDVLIEQLKEAIRDVQEEAGKDPQKVFFDDDSRALRLTYVLEKVSAMGLKKGVFGRTTVWDYLKNIDNCLPGSQSPLEWIVSSAKSDIGLVRVFYRHTLNEGT